MVGFSMRILVSQGDLQKSWTSTAICCACHIGTFPGRRNTFLTWVGIIMTNRIKSQQRQWLLTFCTSLLQGRTFPENPEAQMFTIIGNEAQKANLMDHLCFIFGFRFIKCNKHSWIMSFSRGCSTSAFRDCVSWSCKIIIIIIIGFNRFSQSYYLLNLPTSLLI